MSYHRHYLEALLEEFSAKCREERIARGHMTLGVFIKELEKLPPDALICFDTGAIPGKPLSYRGYYDELAFGYDGAPRTTVADMLAYARNAMGRVFEGYKGGDYVMHENTPLWGASYGTSNDGRMIMGVALGQEMALIITQDDDE